MTDLAELKKRIVDRVNEKLTNHTWDTFEVAFEFPPTAGKASEFSPKFTPESAKTSFTMDFNLFSVFFDYIEMMMNNGNEKVNQILFKMEKGKPKEAFIEASFNQKIVDDFENT